METIADIFEEMNKRYEKYTIHIDESYQFKIDGNKIYIIKKGE